MPWDCAGAAMTKSSNRKPFLRADTLKGPIMREDYATVVTMPKEKTKRPNDGPIGILAPTKYRYKKDTTGNLPSLYGKKLMP